MLEWLESLGLLGLFLGTFLAATVLPFSSDALYLFILAASDNPLACFVVGTAGNWLGGVTTYKSCPVKDFLSELPLKRIVLETDAPYLSPVPHRGKRNEPAFMVDTARRIAEIRQCPLEEIAEVTTENALGLFNLMV